MFAVMVVSTGFTSRWGSACIPRPYTPVEAKSPPQKELERSDAQHPTVARSGRTGRLPPFYLSRTVLGDSSEEVPARPTYASTTVLTSNAGGCSRCFFTAHWFAALISASWYFSGKPGGTWMSIAIWPTRPVRGSISIR